MKTSFYYLTNRLLALAATLLGALCANAGISLPAIISDNMVMQQHCNAKLWGTAAPGECIDVTTTWSDKTYSATADNSGHWELRIATPGCSNDEALTFASASDTVTVKNVMVGEVWLCSGQSNMEFPVGRKNEWQTGMSTFESDIQDAEYPMIHLFKVDKVRSIDKPRTDCNGRWIVCNAENVYDFSAIAFVVGRDLYNRLHRPVGMISCAWGGSPAESWTKRDVMENDPLYASVFQQYSLEKMAPKHWEHKVPGMLWNSMVSPILGYTVKGNIWYQGESNAFRAADYPQVFTNMVRSWRDEWQQRMPFYCMMVAPHSTQPAELRMAQMDTWLNCGIKDIGLATVIDRGDSLDLHPRDKLTAGKRLAAWVLAKEYSVKVPYMGPLAKSCQSKGNAIVVKFSYAKGLRCNGNAVNDLQIAGADGIFHPASGRVAGGKLVVTCDNVTEPVAVRYCQSNYCEGNLYNSDDLPAYPFVMKIE